MLGLMMGEMYFIAFDYGLGHMTCFGQRNIKKCDVSRFEKWLHVGASSS